MDRAARAFALLICLLPAAAGLAAAQVATTDLAPATLNFLHPQGSGLNSTNIAPDNPAALAWGNPSRIAIGTAQGDIADNIAGMTLLEYTGQFGGLRFVGETFGLAAETYSVEDDSGYGVTLDEASTVQLSLAATEWLSFGIGAGSGEADPTLIDPSSSGRISLDRTQGGATVRLGEVWYLGAGLYQDEVESLDNPLAPIFERDGKLFGLALRTEGEWNWYVAFDVVDLDDFDSGASGQDDSIKLSSLTAQLRADWFFIGLYGGKLDVGGNRDTDVTSRAIDLGYAPMEGLNISARLQATDVVETDPMFPVDATVETTSVAIAWMF